MATGRLARQKSGIERYCIAAEKQGVDAPFYDHLESEAHEFSLIEMLRGSRFERMIRPAFAQARAREMIVRRTLDVARMRALQAYQIRKNDLAAADWQQGIELAAGANTALVRLLTWMSRHSRDGWRSQEGMRRVVGTARQVSYVEGIVPEEWSARQLSLVESFVNAAEYLKSSETNMRLLRKSVLSQFRGDPEKQAFVEVLADGWTVLFSSLPTLSPGGKFREFVDNAWTSIGGEGDENFTEAIRTSVRRCRSRGVQSDDWRPDWLEPGRLGTIIIPATSRDKAGD